MPLIHPSTYRAPLWLRDGHAQTLYAAMTRHVDSVVYERQRIDTVDGDFLDLDWSRVGANRVAIISHGLEGNSRRPYILGMVRSLNSRGWDVVAWNFRGCSGSVNRRLQFTHSGATQDLAAVVNVVQALGDYQKCGLVGFSLGGNLTLKYLADLGKDCPSWLIGGVGISVPIDLKAAAEKMAGRGNRFYMRRFLGDLRTRLRILQDQFPGQFSLDGYESIRDFRGFDQRYTAPLHGYRDAEDYWERSSSVKVLDQVAVPVLLLNSRDDPFLPPACFPVELAQSHPMLTLEAPVWGGHVGFVGGGVGKDYWSEIRTAEFLEQFPHDQRPSQ